MTQLSSKCLYKYINKAWRSKQNKLLELQIVGCVPSWCNVCWELLQVLDLYVEAFTPRWAVARHIIYSLMFEKEGLKPASSTQTNISWVDHICQCKFRSREQNFQWQAQQYEHYMGNTVEKTAGRTKCSWHCHCINTVQALWVLKVIGLGTHGSSQSFPFSRGGLPFISIQQAIHTFFDLVQRSRRRKHPHQCISLEKSGWLHATTRGHHDTIAESLSSIFPIIAFI